ncbi:MAG: DNA polymerase III subunit delta [Patescibacteria group bacterium]
MVYLIYGEDNYRSGKKLEAIKEKYRSTCGDMNLVEIDATEANYDFLINQISASPFLANKRLVIIKYLSRSDPKLKERLLAHLKKIPDSTVLFFYEESIDRRTNFLDIFIKAKIPIEEFTALSQIKLKNWIKSEFEPSGVNITSSALEKLISSSGSNLWNMGEDIKKIINYKVGQKHFKTAESLDVTEKDVSLLVKETIEVNVFHYVDFLISGDLKKSLDYLQVLLSSKEEPIRLLGLIVSQFRSLIMIKDLLDNNSGITSGMVAKQTGINPYVVSKFVGRAKMVQMKSLKEKYNRLYECDKAMKTGKIEPNLALYLLTVRLCDNFNK